MSVNGFRNSLTSTIINSILSIFTIFRFTHDLATHEVFQVEVNMNALRELLITLLVSLSFTVMLTSLRKLLSNIHLQVFTLLDNLESSKTEVLLFSSIC